MKIVITGGAGFLGSNLAVALQSVGHSVLCIDNMSRRGSKTNAAWLIDRGVDVIVRDFAEYDYDRKPDVVIHLAAQVTLGDSYSDPVGDFETNARSTLTMLEKLRVTRPFVIGISTNKVYGDNPAESVDETAPLVFDSPYALSKGIMEQYLLLYSKYFRLSSCVLRCSCMYGPRQFGIEGQGWIEFITRRILKDRAVTVFGDGTQVRDILHVDDLVSVVKAVINKRESCTNHVFNIGGGLHNALSVNDAIEIITEETEIEPEVAFEDSRDGDQKRYVSNIRKAKLHLDWEPKIDIRPGIKDIIEWVTKYDS